MDCPYCKSKETVWRGYRYNRATKKRLRLCKKCGRKFTPDDRFLRMRFRKDHILKAIKLYDQGLSSSDVVRTLKKEFGIKVSRWTIICWGRKYQDLIKK